MLVAGPDIDASGAWDAAVALAERQNLPVFATPAPGGGRIGFPEGHPNFRGVLPPAIGPVAETLAGRDLILVVGSSVFPYYPNIPGPLLPEGAELVADHLRPRRGRAGADGRRDRRRRQAHARGAARRGRRVRPRPRRVAARAHRRAPSRTRSPAPRRCTRCAAAFPEDGIVVLEAPSSTLALRNQLRLSKPGSYYFGAGGGLGFGLSAAVGVQLAQPDRPVVCVVGEGSVQYAVTAFWSAVAYDVPVTFLVLRNSEYAILKWFSAIEGVEGAPGLDLPALDTAAVAAGYGVGSTRVEQRRRAARGARRRRSPPTGRSWSRSGSRRGCGCSRAAGG